MKKTTSTVAVLVLFLYVFGTFEKTYAMEGPLSLHQKAAYYNQYTEIVEKIMQQQVGISIVMAPMEEFDNWVEPKVYEEAIQNQINEYLTMVHNHDYADKRVTEITKTANIYLSDMIRPIEVTGKFETQYNPFNNRQLFASFADLATQSDSVGTWKQSSFEAFIIDGGRTISVHIEGIYIEATKPFKQEFTIEFYCDEQGNIF
nr:hypothetical protein [Lysinibacillus timonensis]